MRRIRARRSTGKSAAPRPTGWRRRRRNLDRARRRGQRPAVGQVNRS